MIEKSNIYPTTLTSWSLPFKEAMELLENKVMVSPSLLSADMMHLGDAVELVNRSVAEMIHVDVMDGVFVPNISYGMPVTSAIKEISTKLLDVHLMIVEPERYLERFKACGADFLTIHYEATKCVEEALKTIRELGMHPSLSIRPDTPVEVVEPLLPLLDMVLVMGVNPGFGAQKFIEATVERVAAVKAMILSSDLPVLIEVDGGVNLSTGMRLVEAGCNVLVAGNFVFKAPDPLEAILSLSKL